MLNREEFVGKSCALYSSWLYHPPRHCLFDAGEGVAWKLKSKVNSIQKIFITHEHTDHVAGLFSIVNVRKRMFEGGGNNELRIYYPDGNERIPKLLQMFNKNLSGIVLCPMQPDQEVALNSTHVIKAFKTKHTKNLTLGYALEQLRTKLAPEIAALGSPEAVEAEIKHRVANSKSVSVPVRHGLFAYTGDTVKLPKENFKNLATPEILIHDATYHPDDKSNGVHWHSTFADAVQTALELGAKTLVLWHVSIKYQKEIVQKWISNLPESTKNKLEIVLW